MWGKAILGKAVDEGGRRARICLSICLGAAAAGVLAAPFAGPLRPVVLAVSGAVVLIFGVSAWVFWGHSVEEAAVERRAESESGLIAHWTYTEREWKAYMTALWEIEEGGGFRTGVWIATPFGAGIGALFGLMYRDNPLIFAVFVIGGAASGFGFVRGLRGLSLLFTGPDVIVPTLRVSQEAVRFKGNEWRLSERSCYISAVEATEGLMSLTFTNADTLDDDYEHILVPMAERGRTDRLIAFFQRKISENHEKFKEGEEEE